jgi:hypothetical protein
MTATTGGGLTWSNDQRAATLVSDRVLAGWWVAATFVQRSGGDFALAELRISPTPEPLPVLDGRPEVGERNWSLGAGGLSARQLRSIQFGRLEQEFKQHLANIWLPPPQPGGPIELEGGPDAEAPRPRITKEDLMLAQDYAALSLEGVRNIAAVLAERYGVPAATLRSRIHELRTTKRLLTPTRQGSRSGGQLTAKAQVLIASAQSEMEWSRKEFEDAIAAAGPYDEGREMWRPDE